MKIIAFMLTLLITTSLQAATCEELGYNMTEADCPNGGVRCPAEPEKMFCCKPNPCGTLGVHRYDQTNCAAADGLQLSGVECGGKWTECRECGGEYRYNQENCRSPRVLAGSSCAGSYTECVYPSGFGCIPTAGYIYYADGSCHADYDDSKVPVGIIYDATNKLVIAFDEHARLTWNDGSNVEKDIEELKNFSSLTTAQEDMNGQANTDIIIAYAESSGQAHRAAQYCAAKTDFGKKWFLASLGQLKSLWTNKAQVVAGLAAVPNTTKLADTWYWTSTERSSDYAWYLNLKNGEMDYVSKKRMDIGARDTRCSFAF